MENFLPALLIIGGVIYKIYAEYQKEQEKARRRMPQVPIPAPPLPSEQPAQRTVIEPTMSIPIPVPPKKRQSAPVIPTQVKVTTSEAFTEKDDKKLLKKITPKIEGRNDAVSFDLREAVINAAILNRPYQ